MNQMNPKPAASKKVSEIKNGQPNTVLQRFEKSMIINFEKWHDGIGYDLEALKMSSSSERKAIEQMLITHSPRDWRDIEALAILNTEAAREAIKEALNSPDPTVRVAVGRYAPDLVGDKERSKSIVDALQNAELFGGLSQVLDEVEIYHPQEVKEALIAGLLRRKGDVAVLFAAMLFYIYGKAKEPFDMEQRPFFLRFNTEDKMERLQVFIELCNKLGIDSKEYFNGE
jgi:hypothetical protein